MKYSVGKQYISYVVAPHEGRLDDWGGNFNAYVVACLFVLPTSQVEFTDRSRSTWCDLQQ